MQYLLVVIGFALLIKGADWLVESAKKIAFALGVSAMVIGMSVVALGTSMPEVAIGVLSGVSKTNAISLGDVIGSCIANVALILGVGVLILPMEVDRKSVRIDIPLSLLAQIILAVMLVTGAVLTRARGVALLVLFGAYCYYLFRKMKSESLAAVEEQEPEAEEGKPKIGWKPIVFLVLGLGGLVLGAKLVVDNAVLIARQFGMSEALIGVTIVALGTSLPELITTIVAAVKKHSDIAVGNIVGSNILNICLVLGLTVTINPIATSSGVLVDAGAMVAVTVALLLFSAFGKRLGRVAGVVLLVMYAAFITYSVISALGAGH